MSDMEDLSQFEPDGDLRYSDTSAPTRATLPSVAEHRAAAPMPAFTTRPELDKHMAQEHGGALVGGTHGDVLDRHDMLHGTTDCGHTHLYEARYSPDQSRDDHGRFEGEGGSDPSRGEIGAYPAWQEGGGVGWSGTPSTSKAPSGWAGSGMNPTHFLRPSRPVTGTQPRPTAETIHSHMKDNHGMTHHMMGADKSAIAHGATFVKNAGAEALMHQHDLWHKYGSANAAGHDHGEAHVPTYAERYPSQTSKGKGE